MSTKLAIIAALPREIASLVRGLKPHPAFTQRAVFLYEIPGAVVVAGGMGERRVTLALEAARTIAPIATVISVGLAGACTAELAPGTVAEACTIIDVRTGERFFGSEPSPHTLATSESIAGIAEKKRLSEAYNAAMVDMEAATLARLAHAHTLRFRAIKAVSDGHDFELPSLSLFADRDGHFRTGAFALHTALHPSQWSKAAQLGRESSKALKALDAALRTAIEQHG
ncbi:adenosylhomocysteine nucleosidase [Bryocella elongata]|uniref:Adenosylhomocysteine nucleosidase n=1 Tax=Bryocella elongata TaxID=863522 RepID=A0A1H5U1N7_9BACT|nr:phosphorylase [Bryocella elongata]SEF69052.1 adenosylhomocysteine nucleosidase [Bryocella elongata]